MIRSKAPRDAAGRAVPELAACAARARRRRRARARDGGGRVRRRSARGLGEAVTDGLALDDRAVAHATRLLLRDDERGCRRDAMYEEERAAPPVARRGAGPLRRARDLLAAAARRRGGPRPARGRPATRARRSTRRTRAGGRVPARRDAGAARPVRRARAGRRSGARARAPGIRAADEAQAPSLAPRRARERGRQDDARRRGARAARRPALARARSGEPAEPLPQLLHPRRAGAAAGRHRFGAQAHGQRVKSPGAVNHGEMCARCGRARRAYKHARVTAVLVVRISYEVTAPTRPKGGPVCVGRRVSVHVRVSTKSRPSPTSATPP